MTTAYSTLLGLALPVQGELSGTWGDTVDNGITRYLDIAVAGTVTLTNDGAVTLSLTNGDSSATNIVSSLTGAGTVSAQFAIIRVTGTLTVAKVLTAPSSSRTYVVVNAATGSTVTVKASGQTGVSIAVGETAFVYFNGTDYVKVSGTASVTSFTAGTTGLTPNTATTGAVTLAGTLATTNGGTGLTSFTSGGVVFASSSSALATGSALTFDGTNGRLGIGTTSPGAKINVVGTTAGIGYLAGIVLSDNATTTLALGLQTPGGSDLPFVYGNSGLGFGTASAERMRIDSSGRLLVAATTSLASTYLLQVGGPFQSISTNLISITDSSTVYRGTPDGTGYEHAQVYSGRDATSATYGSYLAFYTENKNSGTSNTSNEKGRFTAGGDFLIGGTASGQARLDIQNNTTGSVVTTGLHLGYSSFDFYGFRVVNTNNPSLTSAGLFKIQSGTTSSWRDDFIIDNIGNVGLGTPTTSSYRFNILRSDGNAAFFTDGVSADLYIKCTGGVSNISPTTGILAFGTSSTERMRLDSSGNLGLGVTPSAWNSNFKCLQMLYAAFTADNSNGYAEVLNNAYASGALTYTYVNSLGATRYSQQLGAHKWFSAASGTAGNAITFTQAMTLDSSGNLLVGQASQSFSGKVCITFPSDTFAGVATTTSAVTTQIHYRFANGNGVVGSITTLSSATLFNTTSDQRLKENIFDAPEFGSVIDSIKVRSFDWKTDNTHQRAGFVAQELVTVAPEAVHQPANEEDMMAVDYSKLVPMLVKEIQSLRKRLTALEST